MCVVVCVRVCVRVCVCVYFYVIKICMRMVRFVKVYIRL